MEEQHKETNGPAFGRYPATGYEARRKHVASLQWMGHPLMDSRGDKSTGKERGNAVVAAPIDRKKLGQIVLVLQGGGALGAYQGGVYQALQEVGVEPDWVIGTIGAINASLIAGNPPEMRLERLRDFWDRVRRSQRLRSWPAVIR